MTQSRLDELNEKIKSSSISLSEIAEIASATLESNSRHSKEIKSKLKILEEKMTYIEEKLDEILSNQSPAFGVIIDDDED